MSDLFKKLKLAADSVKKLSTDIVNGEDLLVSDEVFNKRNSICQQCPKHIKKTNQCGECGCFLALKTKGTSFKCPLGKW